MFLFKKKDDNQQVSNLTSATVILAILAFCFALGAARWSWATTEEQIQIRKDFLELKNQQDQLKIQFDFWDRKVSAERAQLRAAQQQNVNGSGTTKPAK